jgi:hypothetical protein
VLRCTLRQVYLAANGARSVQEIAAHLKMKRQNVSPELKVLAREGLLEIVDEVGGRDVWAKTAIDKSLRISRFLCQDFTLGPEGRSTSVGGRQAGRKSKPRRKRRQT